MATNDKLNVVSGAGLAIVLGQVTCEVGKQISNYSLQVYNGGHYPLPHTLLVLLMEVMKLAATVVRAGCRRPSCHLQDIRKSLRFLLPSLLFAINNNIYMYGLLLVPPPVWIILCSFRTVVTASLYKFVLKRNVTGLQFVGVLMIVASIVLAKLGDGLSGTAAPTIPLTAVLLACLSANISVAASVYTESLFKASDSSFLEQQFWLYLYGSLVSGGVHLATAPLADLPSRLDALAAAGSGLHVLLGAALLFGSVGGLVVASILKRLDNIVKEYSVAVSNMFTAVISSFLFPDKFSFTLYIFLSLLLLCGGIFIYETQKAPNPDHEAITSQKDPGQKEPGQGVCQLA